MATFLTWASDVLEKVDQSAANLSDGRDRGRRPRRRKAGSDVGTEGENVTDGQLSDFSGYGSDFTNDWKVATDIGVGEETGSSLNETLLQVPSGTMRFSAPNVYGSVSNSTPLFPGGNPLRLSAAIPSSQPGNGFSMTGGVIPPWNLPPDISSAVYAAKAPSLAMENLRVIRRRMEGNVWQQSEVKKEFEDMLRQTSEVEAKVSVLVAEIEKLQKTATLGSAMNAQELVNLREESQAAQIAYGKEKNAHSATRIQSQMRESSLAAENMAYSKALSATNRHREEKASEAERWKERAQEIREDEQRLQMLVSDLMRQMEEERVNSSLEVDRGHGENSGLREGTEEDKGGDSGDLMEKQVGEAERERQSIGESFEIREKRRELAGLDAKVAALEKEFLLHQQSLARWPSSAQREKELERRLRGLNEQLMVKQNQAETLANERAGLQVQLDRIQEARNQLKAGDIAENENRRIKMNRPFGGNPGNSRLPSTDFEGKLRPRSSRAVSDSVARVAETVNALSLSAGAALQKNSVIRSLLVVYVLGLHLVVFIILSFSAAQKALGGI